MQHNTDETRIFHTPGIYYRPASLKNMTALLGDTETRAVYDNFELKNLNSDAMDASHEFYQKYLEHHFFVPAGETAYFNHTQDILIPETPSTAREKGCFNVFPLSLAALEGHRARQSRLGVVSMSPLKLELEFEPVLTETWFVAYTFVYTNRIEFTGSPQHQDVVFDQL